MSDWNSLENRLRKWTPRRPSPELRSRIFRSPAPALAVSQRRLVDFSQWLIPAFGCFLLVLATLSSRYPTHAVLPPTATNFLAENGPAYAEMIIASGADHSDKNALPVGHVEWNFGGRASNSQLGVLPVSYTNKIIQ